MRVYYILRSPGSTAPSVPTKLMIGFQLTGTQKKFTGTQKVLTTAIVEVGF
jgi:hypothetical protein